MNEPLSPAAQAILAAFNDRYKVCGPLEDSWQEDNWQATCLAAALCDLADAVVPEENNIVTVNDFRRQRQHTRNEILAIATELENHEH